MPRITFLPMGTVVEAQVGDTILETAIQSDVPLQHACGGFCACTTCHVIVKSGAENISPMEEDEQERLESTADQVKPESRLGCQSKVLGDVTVEIVNVDL